MFKFMKSKKGFTLVELMIVVVIMAILVAVAVPIFSAVTKNARIKTCAANRREIVAQVNGFLMGNIDGKQHTAAGSYVIDAAGTVTPATTQGDTAYTKAAFEGLFQEVPVCPNDGKITVSIIAASATGTNETTANVLVACNSHTDAKGVAADDLENTVDANTAAHEVQTAK